MKDIEREQAVIRQYLLGELDEDRQEQLEQRVMTEREFKQEVLIVEEELVDEFVSGVLSGHEQEMFRKNYLTSPNQRRKVVVARALGAYASNHKPSHPEQPKTGWLDRFLSIFRSSGKLGQLSWAAIVVLIIAASGLVWWLLRNNNANELATLNGPQSSVLQPGPTVASVDLSGIHLRSDGPKPVAVSTETQIVQLRIVTDKPKVAFLIVLRNSAGQEIARLTNVSPRELGSGQTMVIQIPLHLLPPGDYELELSQADPVGQSAPRYYSFQIPKT